VDSWSVVSSASLYDHTTRVEARLRRNAVDSVVRNVTADWYGPADRYIMSSQYSARRRSWGSRGVKTVGWYVVDTVSVHFGNAKVISYSPDANLRKPVHAAQETPMPMLITMLHTIA